MTDVEETNEPPKTSAPPDSPAEDTGAYQVLARKYRPQTFAELVGQEALVRTLTNALASGRLAQAFILTGVRGVGKTTTARIIARALNCTGVDGSGVDGGGGDGAALPAEPCGVCDTCQAIAEDRHVDVIEMDAASRTGIDDIRELIEGVRYRPISARYKVYIIDEVHMLSKNAFNALLKTLEEPPPHVKFIFATTEIRKVPVTVLSRCQRFDLRRLGQAALAEHLGAIAAKEGAVVEDAALAMLARAADGSVRDGLSLLDQAIALGTVPKLGAAGVDVSSGDSPSGNASSVALSPGKTAGITAGITAEEVREMLGLADRAQTLDLFDIVMKGAIGEALRLVAKMYEAGAEPMMVIQDLLDLTHWLTRLKLVEGAAEGVAVSEAERGRATEMAGALSMPVLARAWQMLLKGLAEIQVAPAPITALEMVLVRLAYAAELPAPAELVKSLSGESASTAAAEAAPAGPPAPTATPAPTPTPTPPVAASTPSSQPAPSAAPISKAPPAAESSSAAPGPVSGPRAALAVERDPGREAFPEPVAPAEVPAAAGATKFSAMPQSFAAAVDLFAGHRKALLHTHLTNHVHLVDFEPGRIEIRPTEGAPADLANSLGRRLSEWTGERWVVAVSGEPGEDTLAEQAAAAERAEKDAAAADPLVRAVLDAFPGAAIETVRLRAPEDAVRRRAPEDAVRYREPEETDGGDRASDGDDEGMA